ELEFFIARVRDIAAKIDIYTRGAERGTCDAQRNRILGRKVAHALQPVREDRIAGKQVRVLVDLLRERLDEGLNAIEVVERRLHRQPADAKVAGHHPLAGHGLKEPLNLFALAERVEEDGQRADVHRVRAQPDQVRVQPRQLGQQHADPLRLLGNLQLQELFDGQTVAEIVGHRAEVIDPISERHYLLIELGLAGLLDTRVQIADLGIDANDDLAVDLQHQTQNPVSRGMLRPHVQDHVVIAGWLENRRLDYGAGCARRHQRYPSTG